MKDLSLVYHFFGFAITNTSERLHHAQFHYALTIIEKTQMVDCKPMSTPLEAKTKGLNSDVLLNDLN